MRIALGLALLSVFAVFTQAGDLPGFYLIRQDLPVIVGLAGLLLVGTLLSSSIAVPRLRAVELDWRMVVLGAAAIAILLWAGTYLLMDNYPLTRDEHMVVFDVAVFRGGRLAVPLPPPWRPFANALTPAFVLPLPGHAAWVSNYMPTNAMLRTAFGAVLDPALMNPALVGIGALALFDIGRRIFPETPSAQAIALLLYASSAQVLVTAMTAYAMTGHLILNLVWLALFLRGTRSGHVGAMVIGFIAIGLHQVVFHPLFALPFIDHLRRRDHWRAAVAYLISYAAFGLFWLSYHHIVALSAGISSTSGETSGTGGFVADRVLPLLMTRDPRTLAMTAANLVRFISWENLALVPLMALGANAVRRDDGIARPLAFGVVLTIVAMTILLPYQGHGWGYRYLHGLIGNCALLAAYGWRDFPDRPRLRAFVTVASLATVCGSLPFLAWQAHRFVHPYAVVNRALQNSAADMVVIETQGYGFAVDEVRNQPDLTNRPIRLAGQALTPSDIVALCRRGTIAFVDAEQLHALGLTYVKNLNPKHFQQLRYAAPTSCQERHDRRSWDAIGRSAR